MNSSVDFADSFRVHLSQWAVDHGLADCVESGRGQPWVLAREHRFKNLFRKEWWGYIQGFEHRWARALNSSQCFAVNLFATLAEDPSKAHRFLQRILPERRITETDEVEVRFEHTPNGMPERLGESRQPTQIDVFFEVVRRGRVWGGIGIEVKLTEGEFGSCRGWNGRREKKHINPERDRCLDVASVLEAPEKQCFIAEREGRLYWTLMGAGDSSFNVSRLAQETHCPFRHGLYQMMRNRVALDVYQTVTGAEWTEFAVCVHPANKRVTLLPQPVAGETDAIEAFRKLLRPGGMQEWDASKVLDFVSTAGGSAEWASWMASKYLLFAG